MRRTFYRLFIELTNGRFTSYLLRKFTQSRLSAFLIPSYARVFRIQQDEMERELREYKTLHELFTRRLQPGRRTIDTAPDSVVSPVDGMLEDYGAITDEKQFVIKGKTYSIVDMLGTNERAETYGGGTYMVLYLSPSHYHRIHSPVSGTVRERFVLGRKSYPVNQLGLRYGKEPLSKNYRSVTELVTESSRIAMVKVGAMFVNSIELLHERDAVEKGEEMAYFTFGSTVVLLFEKNTVVLDHLDKGKGIRVGERLGRML
ncbi:phosphatidylserine decarboxylase [Ectobacillus sp. JY-23]|uniref:phosphatidylserine decarboxylase n=1 Tax=Ectobacillus sp. JY-23 TaxID=2933872 RepID=UPI001FF30D18|nr:phosphatidylserine decarboxylase [Ectobacillus sp. JY-23]UOY94079.1 phosphatidylserine decarboxylase [Ectobacillus sp. JY-23]